VRGVLLAALLVLAGATAVASAPPPVFLVVVLDGTRSDRVGCGYAWTYTAPTIARLCATGAWFPRAYAQSSWGPASTASLLTGTLPSVHGVNAIGDVLSEERPTLGSALAGAKYLTAAFTTDTVDTTQGLLRGFADVQNLPEDEIPGYRFNPAERSALPILGWVEKHRRDLATRGTIILVHVAPARLGFLPPFEYVRRFVPPAEFDRAKALAARASAFEIRFPPGDIPLLAITGDAGVALADDILDLVLNELRAPEIASRLWIIVVSSYGEALGEHGLVGHGTTLYDESIRVPLLIVPPAGRAGRAHPDAVVELADLLPTILDLAGVQPPAGLRGRSLRPAIEAGHVPEREAVAEIVAPSPIRIHTRAVIDPGLQKRLERQDGKREMYDLRTDHGEQRNLTR
jgi:arylsulfatase A-like enzyme